MLRGLDEQSKTDTAHFGQLKEQVKTVVDEKVARLMERDKETALMIQQMQELLLENTELSEEVRLYKEEGGVMVLD